MREEESNWFSKWEEQLPSPEELMPLSQSLITPDLALAFNIPPPQPPPTTTTTTLHHHTHTPLQPPQPIPQPQPSQPNSSAEFDSPGPHNNNNSDEPARTLKRPRLVWTPQLHKRFVDAVAHLGIKNAVPKTIMQLMSVDGLTRENVASHLQKYRLYLKRMQGGNGSSASAAADDHLFASSPVPAHFLHPVRGNTEHYGVPFVQGNQIGVGHPHHQIVGHHQLHQGQFRHFGGSMNGNGHFENHLNHNNNVPFLRQSQSMVVQRVGMPVAMPPNAYMEDLETGNGSNGRKVLTLFPTGDD